MGLMPLRHSYGGHKKLSGMSVPLPVTVSLCLACLLVGHLLHRLDSEQAATLPGKLQGQESQQQQQQQQQQHQAIRPPQIETASEHTSVAFTGTQQAYQQLTQQHQQQQIGTAGLPDIGKFGQEFLQQSGLLELRPPVTSAKSGNDFYTVIPYQIVSWYPRILVFPGFVDNSTAAHIIALAKRRMAPSGLAWRKTDTPDEQQQIRTSSGVFISSDDDTAGVLRRLEDKIAQVTLLPPSHGEAFNILRYELKQKYDSHMDTFDPADFGPQYSQRLATVLIYLSEVEEGGETVFKREGRNGDRRPVTDWASCEPDAFKYKPRMGDAVLFFSLDPDLKINTRALHGGCPVVKGEKWVATKWLHEKALKTSNMEAE